ncbi:hypothetical protein RFI_16328, partial [Reticulomyxa filosa]
MEGNRVDRRNVIATIYTRQQETQSKSDNVVDRWNRRRDIAKRSGLHVKEDAGVPVDEKDFFIRRMSIKSCVIYFYLFYYFFFLMHCCVLIFTGLDDKLCRKVQVEYVTRINEVSSIDDSFDWIYFIHIFRDYDETLHKKKKKRMLPSELTISALSAIYLNLSNEMKQCREREDAGMSNPFYYRTKDPTLLSLFVDNEEVTEVVNSLIGKGHLKPTEVDIVIQFPEHKPSYSFPNKFVKSNKPYLYNQDLQSSISNQASSLFSCRLYD